MLCVASALADYLGLTPLCLLLLFRVQAAAAAAAGSSKAKKSSAAAAAALPKRPPANPLMLGLPADAYVLRSVAAVRANDLEQALLLLPFNDALRLLQWVAGWLAQGSQVGSYMLILT